MTSGLENVINIMGEFLPESLVISAMIGMDYRLMKPVKNLNVAALVIQTTPNMSKYIIIRNAYKAPVRRVFDYIGLKEYENPLPHQKKMLEEICDGVDIIEVDHWIYKKILKEHTKPGDYLYKVSYNDEIELVGFNPPKTKKA